jgi:hypothetical protein
MARLVSGCMTSQPRKRVYFLTSCNPSKRGRTISKKVSRFKGFYDVGKQILLRGWLFQTFDDTGYFPLDEYFPLRSGSAFCLITTIVEDQNHQKLGRATRLGSHTLVVLRRPFRAQIACVLYTGVGLYLYLIVEVAVVVAVVAVLF